MREKGVGSVGVGSLGVHITEEKGHFFLPLIAAIAIIVGAL